MKIAIHTTKHGFDKRWIAYCKEKSIAVKEVDCYANDIIKQVDDCDIVMWHVNHNLAKDNRMAKSLLFALQQSGKTVFPDFNTAWHFDDKVGQKYLFESLNVPFIDTFVFYEKEAAYKWIDQTIFPKVFKLRGGAGSANVKLAKTKQEAIQLVDVAFSKGFAAYSPMDNLKERIRLYKKGKTNAMDVAKGVARFVKPPVYSKMGNNEKGYAYFQDFIPNNDSDIRVVVIDDKAFAIKRMVRENDFRASGSGTILYDKNLFNDSLIELTFKIASSIKSQCLAVDYVFKNGTPLLVEMSFGFSQAGYEDCPGYWKKDMCWVQGKFNPQAWMVDAVIKQHIAKQL